MILKLEGARFASCGWVGPAAQGTLGVSWTALWTLCPSYEGHKLGSPRCYRERHAAGLPARPGRRSESRCERRSACREKPKACLVKGWMANARRRWELWSSNDLWSADGCAASAKSIIGVSLTPSAGNSSPARRFPRQTTPFRTSQVDARGQRRPAAWQVQSAKLPT